MKVATPSAIEKLIQLIKTALSGKYDKTGGEISGNVKIDGTLTLDIDDPDYDAGIRFEQSLDTNSGTILTATGYANSNENTPYRPIIRNIGTPVNNYDVANKKYVDDNVVVPTYHLVFLHSDGSVDQAASTLTYATVSAHMTDPKELDYLDVFWENGSGSNEYSRFHVPCVGTKEVNSGNLLFIFDGFYYGIQRWMMFELDTNNVLTTTGLFSWQSIHQKTNDIVANYNSTSMYPSTKAVYDQFQRKPVTVWETTNAPLAAIQADLTANPSWQLTGLDMTPYKRIKVYSMAGKGRTDASTTPAGVLEILLDPRAASSAWGGNYCGSIMLQKPNDSNRLATLTCAVSADKTKFVVLRQTSLYGTAATTNADIGADVFKIEGYYD